jgi:polyisoprenoid-binding protein YceI
MTRHFSRFILGSVALLVLSGSIFAASYTVDAAHSHVGYSVKHMFTKSNGQFNEFEGSFNFDEKKVELSDIAFKIKASSINSGNPKRDEHLNNPDFFDTAKYPEITFKAEKIQKSGKNFKLTGPLTLHGVTKPVIFTAAYLGSAKNPWGQEVASFTAKTEIKRKDFGMEWNKALDNGGLILGDKVTITVEIEAAKQK